MSYQTFMPQNNPTGTQNLVNYPFQIFNKTWTIAAGSGSLSGTKTCTFSIPQNFSGMPLLHFISATAWNTQTTADYGTMRLQLNINGTARAIQANRLSASANTWMRSVNVFAFESLVVPEYEEAGSSGGMSSSTVQTITLSYFFTDSADSHKIFVRNCFIINGYYEDYTQTPQITVSY